MESKRNFDEEAAVWDENTGRGGVIGAIATALFSTIELRPDMEVMDFGCGTGLLSLRVAGQVASLTGLDTSASMLDVFRSKAGRLGLDNVRSCVVDLDQGGSVPGCYDLIVSSMVFHHIKHVPAVLARLHEALNPNGWLVWADLDLDGGLFHSDAAGVFHHGFDRNLVLEWMRAAGFAEPSVRQATEIVRPDAAGVDHRFTTFIASGQRGC